MLRRVVLIPLAVALATLGVIAAPTEAKANEPEVSSVEYPFGVRVPLGDNTYRLYLDTGSVLNFPVVEVRSGTRQWRQRGDGIWIITIKDDLIQERDFNVHVVMKTQRPKRWSGWIKFRRVIPT